MGLNTIIRQVMPSTVCNYDHSVFSARDCVLPMSRSPVTSSQLPPSPQLQPLLLSFPYSLWQHSNTLSFVFVLVVERVGCKSGCRAKWIQQLLSGLWYRLMWVGWGIHRRTTGILKKKKQLAQFAGSLMLVLCFNESHWQNSFPWLLLQRSLFFFFSCRHYRLPSSLRGRGGKK